MSASTSESNAPHAAALASLGGSPATLRRLLDGYAPRAAWQAIAAGRHPADPDGRYRAKAAAPALEAARAALAKVGASVCVLGADNYPPALASDPEAPAVLFCLGDPTVLEGRARVCVVGTRAASHYGLRVATDIGRDLAAAGVVVVTGAARGIDAAALSGALAVSTGAPPVGVVGAPLDTPTCAAQRELWANTAASGALLSELPPGARGARWRFAVRNRVMAALAHIVLVVESHAHGGSLYTVAAARRRGTAVLAVPGSVHSPASAGSNQLLVEGARAVRNAEDVLHALAHAARERGYVEVPGSDSTAKACTGRGPALKALAPWVRQVRMALCHDPATLDDIVRRSGHNVTDVATALEHLADAGLAVERGGWWWLPPG
jgi:DNA processing protein